MIDENGTVDVELLRKISGVPLSEDHIAELVAISIARSGSIGAPDPINSALLKRLHTIETSAKKLLRAVEGDSPEALFIKRRFMNQETRNGVQDLVEWASFVNAEYSRDVIGTGSGTKKRYALLDDFVSRCRSVWIDAGGEGRGSYKSFSSDTGYGGPLLNLVSELLATGSDETIPSDATIHRAIERVSAMRSGQKERK